MRSTILTVSLLIAVAVPALAHEKGAIFVTPKAVAVSGELGVRGEKLSKSTTFKLQLRGTLKTYTLADVRTDTAGRFQGKFVLPASVRAGSYTVVVLASDGDVSARADLMVAGAAAQAPGQMAGMDHAGMPEMGDSAAPHATAEMMEVQVNTTGAEWSAIAAIILLSAAAGAVLLTRAARIA